MCNCCSKCHEYIHLIKIIFNLAIYILTLLILQDIKETFDDFLTSVNKNVGNIKGIIQSVSVLVGVSEFLQVFQEKHSLDNCEDCLISMEYFNDFLKLAYMILTNIILFQIQKINSSINLLILFIIVIIYLLFYCVGKIQKFCKKRSATSQIQDYQKDKKNDEKLIFKKKLLQWIKYMCLAIGLIVLFYVTDHIEEILSEKIVDKLSDNWKWVGYVISFFMLLEKILKHCKKLDIQQKNKQKIQIVLTIVKFVKTVFILVLLCMYLNSRDTDSFQWIIRLLIGITALYLLCLFIEFCILLLEYLLAPVDQYKKLKQQT